MNVLTVAMVVGIIGGVYGLVIGFFGGIASLFAVANLFTGKAEPATLIGVFSGLLVLAAPIAGLVGAGMVKRKPFTGSGLMAVGGIVMLFTIIGIGPAIFLLGGAIVGIIGKYQS